MNSKTSGLRQSTFSGKNNMECASIYTLGFLDSKTMQTFLLALKN